MDIYDVVKKAFFAIAVIVLIIVGKLAFKVVKRSGAQQEIAIEGLSAHSWYYESDLGIFYLDFDQDGSLSVESRNGEMQSSKWSVKKKLIIFDLEGTPHQGYYHKAQATLGGGMEVVGQDNKLAGWKASRARGTRSATGNKNR